LEIEVVCVPRALSSDEWALRFKSVSYWWGQGFSVSQIEKMVGFSKDVVATILRLGRREEIPEILEAYRLREKKARREASKYEKKSDGQERHIEEIFGMSAYDVSARNMCEFYRAELLEIERNGIPASWKGHKHRLSEYRVLRKYGLIEDVLHGTRHAGLYRL
jgi:hypothetical protein